MFMWRYYIWVMTLRVLLQWYQPFGEIYLLHIQNKADNFMNIWVIVNILMKITCYLTNN